MKHIKFKENHQSYKKGEVVLIEDKFANVLVLMGKAKLVIPKKEYKTRMLKTIIDPVTEQGSTVESHDLSGNEYLNRAMSSESE